MTPLLARSCCAVRASAWRRTSRSAERREADGTLTLSHEVVVAAPAAEVWAAISTPEGWRTWAVPVVLDRAGDPDSIESSYTPTARPGDPSIIRQHFARPPARPAARLPHHRARRRAFRISRPTARVTSFFELEPVDAAPHPRPR